MRGRHRGGRARSGHSEQERGGEQGSQGYRREGGWGDEREWDGMGGQGRSMGGSQSEGYRGRGGFQGGDRAEGYRGEGYRDEGSRGRQWQGYQGERSGEPRGSRHEDRGHDETRFQDGGYADGYGEGGYGPGGRWGSRPERTFPGSSSFGGSSRGYGEGYEGAPGRGMEREGGEGSYHYGDGELYGASTRSGGMERNRRGQFTGRGPKGYQRSDERIREDVSEALSRHGDVDASEISVEVRGGEVILTGTVDSREAKREAERAIENEAGVKEVQNQLRVQAKQQQQGRGQEAESTTQRSTAGTADRETERSRTRGSSTSANL